MKSWILFSGAMFLVLMGAQAHADGFVCQTLERDLVIQAFNHVRAADGTRKGAVLVVSDTRVARGRMTVAKFTHVKATLESRGASYLADVDLRVAESSRGGELISGTRLRYHESILLEVNLTYARPTSHGAVTDGELVLLKRNGDRLVRKVSCARYLKSN